MQKFRKAVATIVLLNSCADNGFSKREPMHEPGRAPQVDCTIAPVRGILRENDPQSILFFAGVPITVQPSSFPETEYSRNATTGFSLNRGLGWHGVAEGGSVTYIANDERPTDMRVSLRYRVDQTRVMMIAEPNCDLRCTESASLATEISAQHSARMNSRNANTYSVSLGDFSEQEAYCHGFCILGNGSINSGAMQEFRIIMNAGEDRVDAHFPIGRIGIRQYEPLEGCWAFGSEKVCMRLQGYDAQRREAHVILRVETECTIVAPQ